MKQSQHSLLGAQKRARTTETQYIKAWLKLLTTAANKPRHIIKTIDSYFSMRRARIYDHIFMDRWRSAS